MNALLLLLALAAQDPPPGQAPKPKADGESQAGEVQVVEKREGPVERLQAPTYAVDPGDLELFKYDDINRILRFVPGVNLREEDGYGLRPNIGIRGTATERSLKVTLMEDGILLAPAPYAAPAAYYFPLSGRMVGVQTYTGPGLLRYGPFTTGGAVNMTTRSIPDRFSGGADLAYGTDAYRKVHLWAGAEEQSGDVAYGFLVEGLYLGSDGFKELDGGGDTGFDKSEFMIKGGIRWGGKDASDHRVVLKLGWSTEVSDETYLGLSDGDFDANPYRRYRGSQLDQMDWDRGMAVLTHEADLGGGWALGSAAYYHRFHRIWERFSRFRSGPDVNAILADPTAGVNPIYYGVLTGAQDSANDDQDLMIATNDREFYSMGVQTELTWAREERGRIQQALQVGVRLHQDQADRLHTENAYRMESGRLVFDNLPELTPLDAVGTSTAVAIHAAYSQRIGDLLVTPRLRTEIIRTEYEDDLSGEDLSDTASILLPGLLAEYELAPELVVHGGVYRGFSPEAPGQASDVDPEESVNWELGAAFALDLSSFSVTGFFNDYDNLTAEDTFSGGGGGTGTQFNGGAVHIFGLEAAARTAVTVADGVRVPFQLAYTWLTSEFLTTFSSANPQFGDVEKGDELPYLPEHQLTLSTGLEGETWRLSFLANYQSWMREEAGQGEPVPYQKVPSRWVFDLSGSWTFTQGQKLYFNALNLLDEEYLVSHRPFGARAGLPFQLQVGVELSF